MTIYLKQSTASQEIPLGYLVDSTNGDTAEDGLTIANTDIKLWKSGATTLADKNSGGATHIAGGIYYCVLDDTDTNTLGPMVVFSHPTGALPIKQDCMVLAANIYDSLIAASDKLLVDISEISGDGTAADNCESFFDGTGYAGTNNVIPAVTTVTTCTTTTNLTNANPTAATIADAVWDELSTGHTDAGKAGEQLWTDINAILVDTGTDGVLIATGAITATAIADNAIDLATFAADCKTGSALKANVETITNGAITAAAIATDAIDADAIKADGAVEIAAAVWDRVLTGATHNIATSAGRRLRNLDANYIHSGTCQAGSATNTIVFDTEASSTDGWYDPAIVVIDGGTGIGQCRRILDYVGSSRTAIVNQDWRTTPDATSTFIIYLDGGQIPDNEGQAAGGGASTITLNTHAVATDDLYIGATVSLVSGTGKGQTRIITDYVGETKVATVHEAWQTQPVAGTGYYIVPNGWSKEISPISAATIADAVWEEAISEHATGTTFGGKNQKGVPSETIGDYKATGFSTHSAADVADAVWDELSTGHTDAGKAGAQLWTDIDAILEDTGTTLDGLVDDIKAALVGYTISSPLYDDDGNMTSATVTANGTAYTVTATYDSSGNLATYEITEAA